MPFDTKEALSPVRESLKRLGLPFEKRCPTIDEVKKALRKKQKLYHPDKTGSSDDADFKQSMKDASDVIDFIASHPELNTQEEEQQEDRFLMNVLRRGEELKCNKGSYTLYLGTQWGGLEELVQATEAKLKATRSGNESHFLIATNSLIIEGMDLKNVTVHLYPAPADSRQKMLIQGKAFQTFLFWVLPEIILDAARRRGMNTTELMKLPPPEDEASKNGKEQDQHQPTEPSTTSGSNVEQDPIKCLITGFQQLERTVVELVGKIGGIEGELVALRTSLAQKQQDEDFSKLSSSLSSIDTSLKALKNQHTELAKEKTLEDVKKLGKTLNNMVAAAVKQGSPLQAGEQAETAREEKRDQALLFTSSIGNEIDTNLLSEKLNVEVTKIEVNHVEKDTSNDEPENSLVKKMREHVTSEVKLVIIQCGSEDVTAAQNATNVNKVTMAAETMVKEAADFAQAANCDVFLSQAPPRYDDLAAGKGDLSKLTEALNSTCRTQSLFLDHVHTVPQGRLACSGKQLESRYQGDGLHLLEPGASLLTKNLLEGISKARPDLVVQDLTSPTAPKQNNQTEPEVRSSREEVRGGGRGGGHGREERINPAPQARSRGGQPRGRPGDQGRGRGGGHSVDDHWDEGWGQHQSGPGGQRGYDRRGGGPQWGARGRW